MLGPSEDPLMPLYHCGGIARFSVSDNQAYKGVNDLYVFIDSVFKPIYRQFAELHRAADSTAR